MDLLLGLAHLLATAAAFATPALPPLPAQGLAVSDPHGITLIDTRGRRLARLTGYRPVVEYVQNPGLPRFSDAAGRRWWLDVRGHRLVRAETGLPLAGGASMRRTHRAWEVRRGGRLVMRMRPFKEFPFFDEDFAVVSTVRRSIEIATGGRLPVPRRCVLASRRASRRILLCGRTQYGTVLPTSIEELVGGRRRLIAGPAERTERGPAGHWVYVRVSPHGRTLLAQWSGECEIPVAFVIARAAQPRPAGAKTLAGAPESVALGWTSSGDAVVDFGQGVCGSAYHGGPGVYTVSPNGKLKLVVATTRTQTVAFWG